KLPQIWVFGNPFFHKVSYARQWGNPPCYATSFSSFFLTVNLTSQIPVNPIRSILLATKTTKKNFDFGLYM
ncbi:hypothetical protein ACJBWC_10570, partial [Streptococcus suis]